MCGRYSLGKPDEMADRFVVEDTLGTLLPRLNVSPTQAIPVILSTGAGRQLTMMRWGITPGWAKRPSQLLINARAETLLERPTFRSGFQQRRVLIPADGFYEWGDLGEGKRPYWFRRKDEQLFAFAGILLSGTEDGVVVLTTTPNDLVQPIHDRMPAMLAKGDEDAWLKTPPTAAASLLPLLRPYPKEEMVSTSARLTPQMQ